MPLTLIDRPTSLIDTLEQSNVSVADRPRLPAREPDPIGSVESAWLAFKTNSIVGTGGQAIGDAIFGPSRTPDPNFNPYDIWNDDLDRQYPFMREHFDSGRVLDFPNSESFHYFLARQKEDFDDRQTLATRGAFVGNLIGTAGPDLGLGAGFGAATNTTARVAQFMAKGGLVARTIKGAVAASASNVAQEIALEAINPDRAVDFPDAMRNAAIYGSLLGAGIPAIGALWRKAKPGIVNANVLQGLRKRVVDEHVAEQAYRVIQETDEAAVRAAPVDATPNVAPATPDVALPSKPGEPGSGVVSAAADDATDDVMMSFQPGMGKMKPAAARKAAKTTVQEIVEKTEYYLDSMADETPVGNRPLRVIRTKDNAAKIAALQEKWRKAGHTLDVEAHPAQAYVDASRVLDELDDALPTGPVAKAFNFMLPGGRVRATPSVVSRFLAYTLFDEAALRAGSIKNPLSNAVNPSAETIKLDIHRLHSEAVMGVDDAMRRHFAAKQAPIDVTLSDGARATVGRYNDRQTFGDIVWDYLQQENEIGRGARAGFSFEAPAAVKEAAEKARGFFRAHFDRADQGKLLQGPRALAAAKTELETLNASLEETLSRNADALRDPDEIAKAQAGVDAMVPATTSVPKQWHGEDLYVYGTELKARDKMKVQGQRTTRTFNKMWMNDFERVKTGDPTLIRTAKMLSNEVFAVHAKRGKFWKREYYLIPKDIVAMAREKVQIRGALKAEAAVRAIEAKVAAAEAKVAQIESFIKRADSYLTHRWLYHRVEGNRDEITKLLIDDWQTNRRVDFDTGAPLAERPVITEALDRLPAKDREVIEQTLPTENAIEAFDAELYARYDEAVGKYFESAAEATYQTLAHIDNAHGIPTMMGGANVLKDRALQIRPTRYRKFMDTNLSSVLAYYDHQMAGRSAAAIAIQNAAEQWRPVVKALLKEEFDGSVEQLQRAVQKEFDLMLNAAGDAATTNKIKAARDYMLAMLDQKAKELRGMAIGTGNPATDAIYKEAGNILMRGPHLALMGSAAVTNIMDTAGLTFTGGMMQSIKRFTGLLRREEGAVMPSLPKRELQGIAVAIDDTIANDLRFADIDDGPINPLLETTRSGRAVAMAGRATRMGSQKLNKWSTMGAMNNANQRAAALGVSNLIIDGAKKMVKAERLVAGGLDEATAFHRVGLAMEDAQRLNRLGFNAARSKQLLDVIFEHGADMNGNRPWATREAFDAFNEHIAPQANRWYDSNRELFDIFAGAVNNETLNVVVRPKLLSRPLMNKHILGRAFNQFWGFAYAWGNQLAVVAAQSPRSRRAQYAASMFALAAVSDAIHNHLAGRRSFDETAKVWEEKPLAMAYKALDRSGLMSWLSRPLGFADRMNVGPSRLLGGDNVSSRFAGNTVGWLGQAGPAFDMIDRLGRAVSGMVSDGRVDLRDLHLLRSVMPFQNLLGIRAAFRLTADAGLDSPVGPGKGWDLYPVPTQAAHEAKRRRREPQP